jgi:hypothetical protein
MGKGSQRLIAARCVRDRTDGSVAESALCSSTLEALMNRNQGIGENWNQLKTLAERQWARIADALEVLAGGRQRPGAPAKTDKTPVRPQDR